MEFPHLRRDTQYPYLDNVDVYSFVNNFDYTRWSEKTRVTLCNVNWNSDYNDVVAFETYDQRDGWFDSLDDVFKIELEQAARIVPEGFVKLPIPYDVMARFDYLFVEIPVATSASNMIDYENNGGIRRWYFFIDEIAYRAPNTTEVRVSLDVWTNYSNDVSITYMMLERGHAPVAYSDVDEYLANPIENNEYLLAPDVNFAKDTIVSHSHFMCFNDSTKYLIFITTTSPNDIDVMGSVSQSTSTAWTNPTYEDYITPTGLARYGHQLIVNGYQFGDDGDYSALYTPARNGSIDRLPSNVYAYAVRAEYCYSGQFLTALMNSHPNFINSVVTTLIVPSEMITLGTQHTIVNVPVYEVVGKSVHNNITLSKSLFDFPAEYRNFAKLYTFPYSVLELTDNDGKTIEVKIESIGNMSYTAEMSLAYPFLNMRVLFEGINGIGSESYTWARIDGTSVNKTMQNGDWYEHCFDWPIPTYALYMDGKTAYNLNNYGALQNERRDALVGYHTSMRGANIAMYNSKDLAWAARQNTSDEMTTLNNNMVNTMNMQAANAALTCSAGKANVDAANDANDDILTEKTNLDSRTRTHTNSCIQLTTATENETSVATTNSTGTGNILSSAVTGAVGGLGLAVGVGGTAMSGGMAAPAAIALGSAITGASAAAGAFAANLNVGASNYNADLVTQCKSTVAASVQTKNNLQYEDQSGYDYRVQAKINGLASDQMKNNNECLAGINQDGYGGQTGNTINCERANTANTISTTNGNAQRNYEVIAGSTPTNGNAWYTREGAELNAKEILENAQQKAHARYNDARNATPRAYGTYSGDAASDYYETRGIQVKVRTQPKSAIRQTGDMFARFGYTLNQSWDVGNTGLTLMKHFTYWKASDIWTNYLQSSNNYVNRAIEQMFLNGVTVWSDPDELGKVSIYDN